MPDLLEAMDLIASGGLDRMRERLERLHRAHGGHFVADAGWSGLGRA